MGIAEGDIDGYGFPEYALTSMGDTKIQKLDREQSERGEFPVYRDIAGERRRDRAYPLHRRRQETLDRLAQPNSPTSTTTACSTCSSPTLAVGAISAGGRMVDEGQFSAKPFAPGPHHGHSGTWSEWQGDCKPYHRFRARIVYHSQHAQAKVPYRYYASLVDMAEAVDVLIVIAPGGPATRHIVKRKCSGRSVLMAY